MIEDKKYCVYVHINKLNNKKYVGITNKEPSVRWGKNGNGYHGSAYFFKAIKKWGWDNFEHIILFNNLSKEDAEQKEVVLIKNFNLRNSAFGYNLSIGGNATALGIKQSDEAKRKKSIAIKDKYKNGFNPMLGKKHTDETKKKQSESHKNYIFPQSQKDKLSKSIAEYWNKNPDRFNGENNPNAKSVICLETNKIYNTIKDAFEDTGTCRSSITDCCNSKLKSAGKNANGDKLHWQWILKQDDDNINVVGQLDFDGNEHL